MSETTPVQWIQERNASRSRKRKSRESYIADIRTCQRLAASGSVYATLGRIGLANNLLGFAESMGLDLPMLLAMTGHNAQ